MQVLQQAAHGKAHQPVGADLGGGGPVPAKLVGQNGIDQAGGVLLVLHQLHGAAHVLFDVVGDIPAGEDPCIDKGFAGMVAAQLGNDGHPDLGVFQLGDVGGAGGDIRKADPRLVPLQKEAGDVVVAVVLQHTALDDGAGSHHPDDVPLDQALGGGRVFHLLADGHLVPFGDQPGHIGLIAVEGHPAHGGPLFQAALLAGEGEVQLPGGCDGIVEKHLIKIADAVK